jgi:hypothetical protein
MSEEYSFPPFGREMNKVIEKFGGRRMETYDGEDITPLWNLQGGGLVASYKYLYAAPRLEKIVITESSFRDRLMSYALNILPDNRHALPIYICFWAESAKGSYFILDLCPTADCICDIPYLERYLDPLESSYSRGIEHYHEISTRDPSWFRAMKSPYFINADIAPSTQQSQEILLGLAVEYLSIYHQLWEKDEPRDEAYMCRLNERKEAVRLNFREKDPGGYMMEKAVGKKLAELSIKALF